MNDLMMDFYNAFIKDEELSRYIDSNSIKFFEYPNANSIKNVIIVIDELTAPIPRDYADNNNLTYEFAYQIDVFVKNDSNKSGRLLSNRLILRVQKILWEVFGFGEFDSSKPEYMSDFSLFRQTKKFKGKQYKREMER